MKEETKDAGGRGVGAGETWSSLGWGGGSNLRNRPGGRAEAPGWGKDSDLRLSGVKQA